MKHIFPPKDMMRMMWQLATGNRLHSIYAPPLCQIQDDRDVINIRTKTTFKHTFLVLAVTPPRNCVYRSGECMCVCARGTRENTSSIAIANANSIVHSRVLSFFVGFLSLSFFRFINLPFHPLACSALWLKYC